MEYSATAAQLGDLLHAFDYLEMLEETQRAHRRRLHALENALQAIETINSSLGHGHEHNQDMILPDLETFDERLQEEEEEEDNDQFEIVGSSLMPESARPALPPRGISLVVDEIDEIDEPILERLSPSRSYRPDFELLESVSSYHHNNPYHHHDQNDHDPTDPTDIMLSNEDRIMIDWYEQHMRNMQETSSIPSPRNRRTRQNNIYRGLDLNGNFSDDQGEIDCQHDDVSNLDENGNLRADVDDMYRPFSIETKSKLTSRFTRLEKRPPWQARDGQCVGR
ncbi:hypothetical protein SmJEL517_g03871 [Synchytrium microbalum]|uniref:Uncharacterized protein n=1 Tax=Synchytrium microbalum TaxID=1806994 RepID=A0A507C2B0_9FUNG|nr:uncharacterized protein SmJEL517_g03871 [Synchytrium microbalum]TPX33189.1 hypothetical protein SmJEL517_g03871 [Synchytrium microbalum]